MGGSHEVSYKFNINHNYNKMQGVDFSCVVNFSPDLLLGPGKAALPHLNEAISHGGNEHDDRPCWGFADVAYDEA